MATARMRSRLGWQRLVNRFYRLCDSDDAPLLVAVNYAPHPSQCYVRLPFAGLNDKRWRLRDLLNKAEYERDGTELQSKGLYLDMPAWHCEVFEMKSA